MCYHGYWTLLPNQAVEDSAWDMAQTVETQGVSKWP